MYENKQKSINNSLLHSAEDMAGIQIKTTL